MRYNVQYFILFILLLWLFESDNMKKSLHVVISAFTLDGLDFVNHLAHSQAVESCHHFTFHNFCFFVSLIWSKLCCPCLIDTQNYLQWWYWLIEQKEKNKTKQNVINKFCEVMPWHKFRFTLAVGKVNRSNSTWFWWASAPHCLWWEKNVWQMIILNYVCF